MLKASLGRYNGVGHHVALFAFATSIVITTIHQEVQNHIGSRKYLYKKIICFFHMLLLFWSGLLEAPDVL